MIRSTTRAQLARLLALPAHAPVRIHTFQHPAALEKARADGTLRGSPADAQYPEAYEWMRGRMADLMPGHSGDLPVWGWLRRIDGREKWREGAATVRITAMVPRGRLLISDLDMWHAVLNDHPVFLDETEHDLHDDSWTRHPRPGDEDRAAYEAEMIPTWDRVFDPLAPADHQWWGDRRRMPLQACIDGVRLDEIVAVRHYPERRTRGRP